MFNNVLFTLLEAQVTLYTTNADGTLGAPLWSGQVAERLAVRERWITVETRPTGIPYPVQNPLVPQFTVEIDRVWALPLGQLNGFNPDAENYILDVLWQEGPVWHRRTFYGVTINARSFASQTIETEFADGQEFQAQYFIPASGSGSPPGPVQATPLTVQYVDNTGSLALYDYTPDAGFTEVTAGQAVSRAVIANDGSSIQFAGAGAPVLVTTAAGVTVAQLQDGVPATLPRLEFYAGSQRLATITATGLWARNFQDTTLPAGGFGLEYADAAVGAIAPGVTAALAWNALA